MSATVVQSWIEDKKVTSDSEGTYKVRRTDLNRFLDYLEENAKELEPFNQERHKQLLHTYFLWLQQEGYGRNTILSNWESLRLLYEDLAGFHGLFDESPFEVLKKKKEYIPKKTRHEIESEKPYISREEKELLCENVPSPSFRNELLIRCMWQGHFRESELVNLKVENVDLENNRFHEFWIPKTNALGSVSFDDSLKWLLDEWLNGGYRDSYVTASESDYLFLTNRSEQMPHDRPNKIIRKAAENAGIQEVLQTDAAGKKRHAITSHSIRRGSAMHLHKSGKSLRTIQKRLRHSSIDVTVGYLPLSASDVSEDIADVQF